jgi:hypothetical protein
MFEETFSSCHPGAVHDAANATLVLAIDVGAELVQDPAPFVARVLLPPIGLETSAENAFY